MKLPSRLSIALGTLVTGLIALSGEVNLSHPLHQLTIVVGAFVLWLIHPQEGSPEALAPPDELPAEGSAVKASPPATSTSSPV